MNLKTTSFSVVLILLLGQTPARSQWAISGHNDGSFDDPVGSGTALWSQDVVQASCDDCGAGAGTCHCARGGIFSGFGSKHRRGGGLFGGPSGSWRFWGDAEVLLWWGKERYVPVLATTSPPGTAQGVAGRRGQPTTSVLFGDDLIGSDAQTGYRGSAGFWFDQSQTTGLGARFFYVGDENDGYIASSAGNPILARPFFNADPGVLAEDALLVAYPGISTGSLDIDATNVAKGGDLYLRQLLLSGYCNRLDFISGYQHTDLDDSVWISHSLVSQDPAGPIPVGTVIDSLDRFKLENQFDGGFVGLMAMAEDGSLTWRLMSKVAFGNMKQSATVFGSTTSTAPGGPAATTNTGLLATPTNIGFDSRDTFAIVPELSVSVGYKLTKRVQLTAGYSLIYWSKVVLAGDIIDTTVNPTQPLVGAPRPAVVLTDDDFWYQGVNAGVNIRF